jgi:hypothetical protein
MEKIVINLKSEASCEHKLIASVHNSLLKEKMLTEIYCTAGGRIFSCYIATVFVSKLKARITVHVGQTHIPP